MKTGKVSQTVLKRSVLKQMKESGREWILPAAAHEMCGCIESSADRTVVSSSTMYGNSMHLPVYAMAKTVNDLASRGARPSGVGIQILLPPEVHESRLREMAEEAARAGRAHAVQILTADVQVSPVVRTAVISVHGVGVQNREETVEPGMGCPGQDIVLLGWVGLEGSLRLLDEKKEELKERFVPAFFHPLEKKRDEIFASEAIALTRESSVQAMQQISEGGILAALWDLSEAAGTGLSVNMKQMSIRQETVELCEFYHLNPYQLTSNGSILAAAPDGQELCDRLCEKGIKASVLGKLTEGREKVILNGEEKRYLDRPAPDELTRIFAFK